MPYCILHEINSSSIPVRPPSVSLFAMVHAPSPCSLQVFSYIRRGIPLSAEVEKVNGGNTARDGVKIHNVVERGDEWLRRRVLRIQRGELSDFVKEEAVEDVEGSLKKEREGRSRYPSPCGTTSSLMTLVAGLGSMWLEARDETSLENDSDFAGLAVRCGSG